MQCEAEPNLSAIYSLPLLLTIRGACWWYRNYMDKAREDLDKVHLALCMSLRLSLSLSLASSQP